jgi:PIN domain nuclease of toxin-antitoxin system
VKLLLDTHVWVWSQEQPEKLGRRTARLLVAAEHVTSVCPVSTLEIARLAAVGEIALSIPLRQWVEQSLADLQAETVPITHEVAMEAYALPGAFSRDPADRVLVAAARHYGLTVITADDRILAYRDVRSHDARR